MNDSKSFSHVPNFTGYMGIAARYLAGADDIRRVLDLPAGNGLLTDALRQAGKEVVSGDINRERPDYRYVNMDEPLPFGEGEFDGLVCLEGVEHLADPVTYIAEMTRVVRPGGMIVISTPNVMNVYSRLQFLFTGTQYQFNPASVPPVKPGEVADRGHVFPLSYFQLRYLFGQHGADVEAVLGDKYKRKALIPLALLFAPVAWWWSRRLFARDADARCAGRNADMLKHAWSGALLFSRSLVLVLRKRPAA